MINVKNIHVAELEEFGCPIMVIDKLESVGIQWLNELLELTPKELGDIKQISYKRKEKTIRAVRSLLATKNKTS